MSPPSRRLEVAGWAVPRSGAKLRPWKFHRRSPGRHDLLVDIAYCGVCHSDIHEGWDYGEGRFPMVPGHEIVGRVSQVGAAVRRFRPGATVGVGPYVASDHTCALCRRGLESYCPNVVWTYNDRLRDGSRTQGGYSSRIVVNERFAFRIDPSLPLERVAPLLCAGITTYAPLKRWGVRRGMQVGVLGLGGLGHMAVKLAAAMGAEVCVFSATKAKEADARRMGARHFVPTSNGRLDSWEGRLDLLLNCTPVAPDFERFLSLLRVDGTFVQLGEPPEDPELPLEDVERRRVTGSVVGGLAETQEMLDYCSTNRLLADVEVIELRDINRAWQRVLRRQARYRYVIDLRQ